MSAIPPFHAKGQGAERTIKCDIYCQSVFSLDEFFNQLPLWLTVKHVKRSNKRFDFFSSLTDCVFSSNCILFFYVLLCLPAPDPIHPYRCISFQAICTKKHFLLLFSSHCNVSLVHVMGIKWQQKPGETWANKKKKVNPHRTYTHQHIIIYFFSAFFVLCRCWFFRLFRISKTVGALHFVGGCKYLVCGVCLVVFHRERASSFVTLLIAFVLVHCWTTLSHWLLHDCWIFLPLRRTFATNSSTLHVLIGWSHFVRFFLFCCFFCPSLLDDLVKQR